MRRPLAAGNWKMHKVLTEARELISGIRAGLEANPALAQRADVVVFPAATLLFPMAKAVAGSPIAMGGQNVHFEPQGAFTGETSIPMLKDTGATYVLIGHSERRHVFGETDEMLAKKARAASQAGLTVVYCVGEALEEREAGRSQAVVEAQLGAALGEGVKPDSLVIAYEPVWAIGTGKTATPELAQEMHAFVRTRIGAIYGGDAAGSMRVLYGGSVKPGNAADLMAGDDVDGVLVGGACLAAEDFLTIILAVAGQPG